MKITSLDQLKDGMRVRGSIHEGDFGDGMITIEGGHVFICQNRWDNRWNRGSECRNKRGYDGTWCVNDEDDFDSCDLETPEGLAGLKYGDIGDILVDGGGFRFKVLGVCGDIVFRSGRHNPESYAGARHYKELERAGFKLKGAEEQKITVTKKEIAEKFGVDVDNLKIKDNE